MVAGLDKYMNDNPLYLPLPEPLFYVFTGLWSPPSTNAWNNLEFTTLNTNNQVIHDIESHHLEKFEVQKQWKQKEMVFSWLAKNIR